MLDLNVIRENTELVKKGTAAKRVDVDIDRVLELDKEIRSIKTEFEKLRADINKTSKDIGKLKSSGADITEISESVRVMRDQTKALQDKQNEFEAELSRLLYLLPNIPDASVPPTGATVIREWGDKRDFGFKPVPHWDLAKELDIIDFERGAKVTGSGFVIFKGEGARLQRSMMNFMLDLHTSKHGYREVWSPVLANRASMTGTGQLPKFEDDMYNLPADDCFLIPTAEVTLTNIHQAEILNEEDLPVKYTGYSECFRREAGAAGKDTRGLIRLHEFSKVELVKLASPETSFDELEALLKDAEEVLQLLNLPYRVILLPADDMSFSSAKTYDIELWCPGVGNYQEVSSCSNFVDFQARRANMRYRHKESGKPRFVHTLNGSGVAFPRLMISIIENYQQADGSIEIPEALQKYMGGQGVIARKK